MTSQEESNIRKDLRLDRFVTWLLMCLVAIIGWGAREAYIGSRTAVKELTVEVVSLNTNVALLQQSILRMEGLEDDIQEAEKRIMYLERLHPPEK